MLLHHIIIVNITVYIYVSLLHDKFLPLCNSFLSLSPLCMNVSEQTFLLLFSPSLAPACRLRICPMFLCDKTPNPITTKGLSTPPSTPSLTLSLASLSHQLPHAASSIHTIISCLHHVLLLLYGSPVCQCF